MDTETYRSHADHGYWLAKLRMALGRALGFKPDYVAAEELASSIACIAHAIRSGDHDDVQHQCAGAETLLLDFEATRKA